MEKTQPNNNFSPCRNFGQVLGKHDSSDSVAWKKETEMKNLIRKKLHCAMFNKKV